MVAVATFVTVCLLLGAFCVIVAFFVGSGRGGVHEQGGASWAHLVACRCSASPFARPAALARNAIGPLEAC
jgi:hypothetical protein